MRALCTLIFGVVLAAVSVAADSDSKHWPQYRGPAGDGRADQADLPVTIDESVVRWKTPIHGKAWSSPVVWGNQIWLTTATEDGTEMSVLCVDKATGKVIHDRVLVCNEQPDFCHKMNSYATPTPLIDGDRVYVHFGKYLTACLDAKTAEPIWSRTDFECNHHRGPASSPILHQGKLFVAYDGFDVQYVVALDAKTGKTVWKKDREINYGTDNGDQMKAYCTAHVITVDGQEQLVCPSAVATIAYAPETGETLWTVYHSGMNASARPVYGDGLVFITNGMGSMVAVRPDGKGDITKSHVAWSSRKGVAKKSSQLLIDGILYMNSDDGVLSARQAKTGDVLWQKRAGGSFAASPIYAGGKIYAFNVEGEIFTFKASEEYEELAKSKLGDGFMASPAVVGHEMVLRSKSHLYLIAK